MSVENLEAEFEDWNPMESDYKNKTHNQYSSGPGANLNEALQPYQQHTMSPGERVELRPYLVIHNVPPKMSCAALKNICQKHGKVLEVRTNRNNDHYFAEFETVSDMEATLRGIKKNSFGFKAFIGKHDTNKNSTRNNTDCSREEKVLPRTTGLDFERRSIPISGKPKPRPIIEDSSIISEKQIMELPSYAINGDAHALERKGVHTPQQNDTFKYQTGRAYKEMPQLTQKFITEKNSESSGRFSPSKEIYVKDMNGYSVSKKFKECIYCNRKCDNYCSRCSAFYCGKECQESDWQQHRYVCGKPQNFNNNTSMEANTSSKDVNKRKNMHAKPESREKISPSSIDNKPLLPKSGSIVTITAISKTNLVFVRSKTNEANMMFFKTVDGLQSVGNKLQPLTVPPECGCMVVAKFNDQFNRALVLNAKNLEKIFVNYIDYGNCDTFKMEDLYMIPEEFLYTPSHAKPVMLRGVPEYYMTDEIRKFMYLYLNGTNVYLKYKTENYNKDKKVYEVELIDESTQQNINKTIRKLAKPTEPVSTNDICYESFLDHKLLPTGNNIELIVMDNSLMSAGCISCTTEPFAVEIYKFQKDLQKYVETIPKACYGPRPDELCIAKYSVDGQWYRGRCLEIVGDGHPTILFIDFGNIAAVHIDDIRRYPPQFTYPIYTADCEIQGLPEICSDALLEKLEELIPNGSIVKCEDFKLASEEDYFYTISLPNVIDKLRESGVL